MSTKNTGARVEPIKTRKSSKNESNKSSSGDIMDAFKMAAKKPVKDKKEEREANENSSQEKSNHALDAHESHQQLEKITISVEDVATQVTPIEIELESDLPSRKEAGVNADSVKQELLEALQELTEKYNKLDDVINHPKTGIGARIVTLTLKGDNLHTDIHSASNGLIVNSDKMQKRLDDYQKSMEQMEANQKRMSQMLAENKKLSSDLITAQGLIQKYSQKIKHLEFKVLDLTKRSMEQNVIIHGIEECSEPREEDCYESVIGFINNNFPFRVDESDIWKTYRIGVPRIGRARPVFVKLSYYIKDKIMQNVAVLKGKKNANQQVLFVSEQIPEGITETRKGLSKRVSTLRDQEASKPKDQRRQVKVIGEHVVVGGEVAKLEVHTPQPYELFPDVNEQKRINAINQKIVESEPKYSMNSSFVGLAVGVNSIQDTNLAYKAVMQRFPFMDHVMMAYQFKPQDGQPVKHGACDDMEFGGGTCVAKFLQQKKIKDIAVFVVRRYGGIHLGLDRFKAIEEVAGNAVQKLRP